VTNLSDHDPGSLRDAIATTPDGGTVDFQPGLTGTITLTSGELAINKDLTIEGPGADVITVSGNNASQVFDRVFYIGNFTVAISGLTIAKGMQGYGGGIANSGTLTITASTFSGNSASESGGGIINAATLIITGCTFSANTAVDESGNGGGIENDGTLTITASTFSGNSARNGAGSIYNEGTRALLTVTASTFSGNSVPAGFGGGINNAAGTVSVTGSTFSGNSAADGGGISNLFGALTITASTFSGNSASNGGGIYNYQPFLPPGTIKIRNTLLAGNSAPPGGGPDVFGALASLGHNLIGIGDGGSGYASTDLVGTSANPIDPKLGPLQDNGGPTQTMALLPGSPAIGAGALTDMEWDQRGPGYQRSVNGFTDIGAYEVQPTGAGSASLTLHFPEPTHPVPITALSEPAKPSMPLRQAADSVDRFFASGTTEATNLQLGRSRRAALGEPGFWPFDFMLAG
jgi:hypothetical protein